MIYSQRMINEYLASLNKGQANDLGKCFEDSLNFDYSSSQFKLPKNVWNYFCSPAPIGFRSISRWGHLFCKGELFLLHFLIKRFFIRIAQERVVRRACEWLKDWMSKGERRGSTRRRGYSESQTPTMVIFQGASAHNRQQRQCNFWQKEGRDDKSAIPW